MPLHTHTYTFTRPRRVAPQRSRWPRSVMDLAAAASMPPSPAPDEGHLVNNFFGRATQGAGTTFQVPAESSASPLAVAQVTAAAQVQANAIVAAPAEQPVTSAALHAQSRDRTGGATGTTIAAQIDAHFSPPTSPPVTAAAQEAASAEAAPVEQRVPRSALGVSGCDSEENYASNRFDKSELCFECGNPHVDSNYVATTANRYIPGVATAGTSSMM